MDSLNEHCEQLKLLLLPAMEYCQENGLDLTIFMRQNYCTILGNDDSIDETIYL